MLANNTNDSIPAWKVPLLERRRQQAEFERLSVADDSARLAQMPAWKREVYLKKRMQKQDDAKSSENSGVHSGELARKPAFRNPRGKSTNELGHNQERSRARDSVEREQTSDSELSDSERLIPIQRNPILQSDLQRRPTTAQNNTSGSRHVDQPLKGAKELPVVCNGNGYSTSPENNYSRPSGKNQDVRYREHREHEEVTYGKGFVNKLLGKFRELSEKTPAKVITSSVPKRYCSSDNLINDSLYDEGRVQSTLTVGNLKYAKGKAQSMENLTCLSAEEKTNSLPRKIRPVSIVNGFSPVTTASNIRSSEQTGKKILTVSLASKVREPADNGVKGSAISLASPSAVVCETSPRPEDELPRSNIVLLTRTVFESIGSSPPIDISNSKKRSSTLPTASKVDDPKVEHSRTYLGDQDAPDGYVSSGVNSNTRVSNNSRAPSASTDLRVSDGRTDRQTYDRTSRGPKPNNAIKTSERNYSNRDVPTSFNSEKSFVLPGSRNMPGNRESLVDASPSPIEPTAPVLSGTFEKPTESGRNGLIVSKRESGSSSQVVQMPSRNGESHSRDFISGESLLKTESTRQHLILDLKDLPVLSQTPVQRDDWQRAENQSSSVDSKNRKKGPGSLLIRPASNLLASSTKVEYLNLTKYNDVKTGDFAPPKKRPLYYDDDDTDSAVPVTNLDDVMSDDDARFSPKEGDPSVYKSHTPTFEFEGAGVRFGKSLLVKSKDANSKQV